MTRVGAVIAGRNTYEAAEAWGGHNPFGVPSAAGLPALNGGAGDDVES
jgi:hypothetical protein